MASRWLLLPTVAVLFIAGVWLAGGVVTDSFRASMALVAVWYAAAGLGVLAIGIRHRALRAPLWAGYAITAAAVGGFLAWTTLRDTVVHERVLVGVPAAQVVRAPERPPPALVTVSHGRFVSGEHETRGLASVVRKRDGRRFLTLTGFDTSPGPDAHAQVGPGEVDLGALKGNRGDQQYAIPRGTRVTSVVIWCRAFSASFGSAQLRAA